MQRHNPKHHILCQNDYDVGDDNNSYLSTGNSWVKCFIKYFKRKDKFFSVLHEASCPEDV
jgi:hypothetical protein